MFEATGHSHVVVVEFPNEFVGFHTVQVAKCLTAIAPSKPFHNLLTNLSETTVHIQSRMIVAHITSSPANIIENEPALLETVSKAVNAAHYKPSIDTGTQVTCQKNENAKNNRELSSNQESKVLLSNRYKKYRDQFWSMLSTFQFNWNGHTWPLNTTKHHNAWTGESI